VDDDDPQRYVFFAMPHIAVDSAGNPGDCIRAGRAGCSHACGALIKLQPKFKELRQGGMQIRPVGTCDAMDPEYSLLESRMLRAVQVRPLPIRPRSRCERRSLRTFPVVAPRFARASFAFDDE
jgi:hypothetical protein